MAALLQDGEEIPIASHHQQWMTAWHPPGTAPSGRPHGSAGICVTAQGDIVLISTNEEHWDLPAGRPEGEESWEQTLRREVLEEACAVVTTARLLGFSCGRCVEGTEKGLVLVRAIWRADVTLLDWQPEHEIRFRKTASVADARKSLPAAVSAIWDRAFCEADLREARMPVEGSLQMRTS